MAAYLPIFVFVCMCSFIYANEMWTILYLVCALSVQASFLNADLTHISHGNKAQKFVLGPTNGFIHLVVWNLDMCRCVSIRIWSCDVCNDHGLLWEHSWGKTHTSPDLRSETHVQCSPKNFNWFPSVLTDKLFISII